MGPGLGLKYQFRFELNPKVLWRRVARADKKALREGAREVQREARNSIKRGRGAVGRAANGRFTKGSRHSAPGNPPFEQSGKLRKSIKTSVTTRTAWIGATRPEGSHGAMLEHGTPQMKPRSYMGPARKRVENRLPQKWRNKL